MYKRDAEKVFHETKFCRGHSNEGLQLPGASPVQVASAQAKLKSTASHDLRRESRADYNALRGDETAAVLFLEQLAKGAPALELANGTGRIALPLAAKRIPVDGIDFSASMLAKLRAKPGADQIAVT